MVLVLASVLLHLRKRDAMSGLLLAIAILTKITPAILLIYFIVFNDRRILYIGWVAFWMATLIGLSLFVAPLQDWICFFDLIRHGMPFSPEMSLWGWLKHHMQPDGLFPDARIWIFLTLAATLLALTVLAIKRMPTEGGPVHAVSRC
jgi:hypothetical protein